MAGKGFSLPFKSFVSCEPLYGISLVLLGKLKAATASKVLNIPFNSFVSCEPLYGISLVLLGELKAATTSPNGDNELPIEAPSLVLSLYKQEIGLYPFYSVPAG